MIIPVIQYSTDWKLASNNVNRTDK